MNVTFMIGNGFDLGIGLRTAYSDFYKVYCKPNSKDSPEVRKFKSELEENYENWSDFEEAFSEYAGRIDDAEDYLAFFEDFVESFSEYLSQEENNFDPSKSDLIIKRMKEALTSYYDIRPADKEALINRIDGNRAEFNFISFNYTLCLNDCLEILKHKPNYDAEIKGYIRDIIHVHGFTDHDMIMGVNDIEQIKNKSFSEDIDITEEIVKPLQNQIIRMNFDNNAVRIINGSDIICVYGMSIGSTDKIWWKLVIDWLQRSTGNHLIILQHRAGAKFPFRWNRIVKEIRSKLFLYGDVPEEKRKSLENRIHIDVNHDIFSMNLRTDVAREPNNTGISVGLGASDVKKILDDMINEKTAKDEDVNAMLDDVFTH